MNAAFLLMPAVGGAAAFKLIKKFGSVGDSAGDVAKSANKVAKNADAAKAVGKADGLGDAAAKGGVYKLVDSDGNVVRTGRTNNLERRAAEHLRNPDTQEYKFVTIHKTDVKAEQRGLEQLVHDFYDPPLNKINPISPTNPNRDAYLDAAFDFIRHYG